LSCADLLGLFIFALDYCWRYGAWPDRLPIQRLLGPTEEPLNVGQSLTISRENLFAGALATYALMMDKRRVPGRLRATSVDVGPSELLHAAAKFITESADTGKLPLEVEIPAVSPLPAAANEPVIMELPPPGEERLKALIVDRKNTYPYPLSAREARAT
jgi:hypothetical protein